MSESPIIRTITDLEKGIAIPDDIRAVPYSTLDDDKKPRSIEALLESARQINANGKFIFNYFSELSTFLLLQIQDSIYIMQKKLHDSVEKRGAWSDEDSNKLLHQLKQYRIFRNSPKLTLDEVLVLQKQLMSWEHPPFKVGHSADEVLSGVPSTPGPGIDYTFPSSVEVHRGSTSVADFDASEY